ncbi:MAG: acyl-CoA thioesterase [Clostridiales bacterium]|jgi:acyl-CoA hydrolase|nr:acyl-CoA thioesterase [Clostridiales bacterium]
MTNGKSVMTELVLPNDTNIIGNLLGGRLLHWIDISGALAATRYANGLVATLTMDTVEFTRPIKMGSIVTLISYVTWTGNTSMEAAVEVYAENPGVSDKVFVTKVYLVFVGIDGEGKKRRVPAFTPQSAQETQEFEDAAQRKSARFALRKEFPAQ